MSVETSTDQFSTDTTTTAFDSAIDWAIGAILAIVGVLAALGGVTLHEAITRPDVAEFVHQAEFQSGELTEAEAIDALGALGQWSGLGLVAAGVMLVLLGAAVVIGHGRARSDDRPTPGWILGVAGALVGSLLSFVRSPLIGGATAGYLAPDQHASGLGTGTLAGVFASLPLLVVAVIAGLGLFLSVAGEVALAVSTVLAIVVVVSLVYVVGLSALGGYLGAWLRTR